MIGKHPPCFVEFTTFIQELEKLFGSIRQVVENVTAAMIIGI
jgi:hypothetical protein